MFIAISLAAAKGAASRGYGPTLVLRRFHLDESGASGAFVQISGRSPGLIAWLLTAVGLDAERSLTLTSREVSFRKASLGGQIMQVVPLPNVSSTECGFAKPIAELILGVALVLGGLIGALVADDGGMIFLVVGLLVGGVLLARYWLGKKMFISLHTVGGLPLGLAFGRSVIEGVPVDIDRVRQVVNLINSRTNFMQERPGESAAPDLAANAPAARPQSAMRPQGASAMPARVAPAAEEWYYQQDGESVGPVAASALRQMLADGSLAPTDQVWSAALPAWTRADQAPGLVARGR